MKLLDIINEEEKKYTPEDITRKDTKKAELIYNLYKKGKFKLDDEPDSLTYQYELPDEWYLSNNEDGTLHIRCLDSLDLYVIVELTTGPWKKRVENIHTYLYRDAKQKVRERFERHNIYLYVE